MKSPSGLFFYIAFSPFFLFFQQSDCRERKKLQGKSQFVWWIWKPRFQVSNFLCWLITSEICEQKPLPSFATCRWLWMAPKSLGASRRRLGVAPERLGTARQGFALKMMRNLSRDTHISRQNTSRSRGETVPPTKTALYTPTRSISKDAFSTWVLPFLPFVATTRVKPGSGKIPLS